MQFVCFKQDSSCASTASSTPSGVEATEGSATAEDTSNSSSDGEQNSATKMATLLPVVVSPTDDTARTIPPNTTDTTSPPSRDGTAPPSASNNAPPRVVKKTAGGKNSAGRSQTRGGGSATSGSVAGNGSGVEQKQSTRRGRVIRRPTKLEEEPPGPQRMTRNGKPEKIGHVGKKQHGSGYSRTPTSSVATGAVEVNARSTAQHLTDAAHRSAEANVPPAASLGGGSNSAVFPSHRTVSPPQQQWPMDFASGDSAGHQTSSQSQEKPACAASTPAAAAISKQQQQRPQQQQPLHTPVKGPATDSGKNSPAVSGNSATVTTSRDRQRTGVAAAAAAGRARGTAERSVARMGTSPNHPAAEAAAGISGRAIFIDSNSTNANAGNSKAGADVGGSSRDAAPALTPSSSNASVVKTAVAGGSATDAAGRSSPLSTTASRSGGTAAAAGGVGSGSGSAGESGGKKEGMAEEVEVAVTPTPGPERPIGSMGIDPDATMKEYKKVIDDVSVRWGGGGSLMSVIIFVIFLRLC